MTIDRLLQQAAFTPEDIDRIVSAYEQCLRGLKLADQSEAVKEHVARKVLEIARTGVRDPIRLRKLALKELEGSGKKIAARD